MGRWRRTRLEAVRLPIGHLLNPVLDDLALAYAADPETVGRLLARHAAAVLDLDLAVVSETAADWEREVSAERAAATRGALLTESMTAQGHLNLDLTPDDADRLAHDLTRCAAVVRQNNSKDHR